MKIYRSVWAGLLRGVLPTVVMLACQGVAAQKAVTVEGEYVLRSDGTVTVAQAKSIALERAKIEALAAEFGTIVSQTNLTVVRNETGAERGSVSQSELLSLGGSEVMGEWIETIGEPEYKIHFEDDMLIIEVKVRGRARRLEAAKADFVARLLRNCTDDGCESSEFVDGNSFYLHFITPVSGYLSVYLVDENLNAYCLLPDRYDEDGVFHVKAGRDYVLFSEEYARKNGMSGAVEEYVFTAEGELEHNALYVLFSPNKFVKAVDRETSERLPRELSYKELQGWMADRRKHDPEFCVEKKLVTIRKM